MSKEKVRSGEKSRKSSCVFADLVATKAVAALRDHVPTELQCAYNQTVVAAFVVCDRRREGDAAVEVVSLGVGTKYVSDAIITANDGGSSCERVRDMHAEVLARRALVRYLLDQIAVAVIIEKITVNPYEVNWCPYVRVSDLSECSAVPIEQIAVGYDSKTVERVVHADGFTIVTHISKSCRRTIRCY